MTIEAENTKEEIREILEKCTRCGLCREICPVLRVMRTENYSPRGKIIVLNENNFEKIIYECNLCKACEEKCPFNLKLCDAFIKARKILVLNNKEIPENKEMMRNLQKTGNIFGEKQEEKKD